MAGKTGSNIDVVYIFWRNLHNPARYQLATHTPQLPNYEHQFRLSKLQESRVLLYLPFVMALLREQFDFQVRPSDKGSEWSDLYEDLFERYIDTDTFDFSDNTCERSSSDGLSNPFDAPISSTDSDPVCNSPIPEWEGNSDEYWRNALGCLQDFNLSHQGYQLAAYPLPCGKAADVIDLEPAQPRQPQPSPSRSVSPLEVARQRKPRIAGNGHHTDSGRSHSNIRKRAPRSSVSPNMMSPSRYSASHKDVWARRMEAAADKYHLFPSRTAPLSPPPSAKLSQTEGNGSFAVPTTEVDVAMLQALALGSQVSPVTNAFQQAQIHTPMASPLFDQANISTPYPGTSPAHLQNTYSQDLLGLQSLTASTQPAMSTWNVEPAQTFDFDFNTPASPEFTSWNTTIPFQPSPAAFHNTQRASRNLMAMADDTSFSPLTMANDFAASGLMINCDPTLISSFSSDAAASANPADISFTTSADTLTSPYYPTLQNYSIPTTPHRRRASSTRSPSSSPQPPSSTRSRRRSSNHRRSKSSNFSTPRSPGGATSSGFVNFTPSDSAKILTGVAPSGSSKTKARREKEAADKRRRLSQAAVRAVVEAGGDLEQLRGAGLIV
ncbi:hypothetical protein LTR66_009876 [Elasticomyces elasticus]|nr:hypothetical protein LTR66_009876 [Elasticomyces elasticus]